MNKLLIPLFIPIKDNQIDYQNLSNIIKEIDNSFIIIENNKLNSLNEIDLVNVYLFVNIINPNNTYFIDQNIKDLLIDNLDNQDYYKSILGNIYFNEIKEYLMNESLGIKDKSLNKFLSFFDKEIKKDERGTIEYILKKKKIIEDKRYNILDNLLGIDEI